MAVLSQQVFTIPFRSGLLMASETGNQAEPQEDPEVPPSAMLALQVPLE